MAKLWSKNSFFLPSVVPRVVPPWVVNAYFMLYLCTQKSLKTTVTTKTTFRYGERKEQQEQEKGTEEVVAGDSGHAF